jgi:general stress protein 26
MSGEAHGQGESRDEQVAKLARLIDGIQVCMFTTSDVEGRLMSRPMAVQQVEFDGDLWFFTKVGGRKAEQIARNPRVNVSLPSRSSWVSISGEAEIVRDVVKAKELWNAGIEAWFPDGPEDPQIVLVKVHADGAEYWDTPGAVVVSVLSFVKAKITGKPHHIDDHKVDL